MKYRHFSCVVFVSAVAITPLSAYCAPAYYVLAAVSAQVPAPDSDSAGPVDGPVSWKKAAEEYRKQKAIPSEPSPVVKRYIIVNRYRNFYETLYEKKDHAAIEKALQEKYARIGDQWQAFEYEEIIDRLGGLYYDYDPDELRDVVKVWTDEYPESHFAWLVRASYEISYAWYWRGSGYTNTVTRHGMEKFEESMRYAVQYLVKAIKLDPADPAPRALLVQISLEAGSPEQFDQAFDKLTAAAPADFAGHFTKLRRLTPKWGGSWTAVDAFVEECDRKAESLDAPLLKWIRFWAYGEMAEGRDGYGDVWNRPAVMSEKLAFHKQIMERWPNELSPRIDYTYFLYRLKRYGEAHEQFESIGDQYFHPSTFGSVIRYNSLRAYAAFRVAADTYKDRDERMQHLQEAIDIDDTQGSFWFTLAGEYRQAKDLETTEQLYKSGIEKDPGDAQCWLGLAGLYREQRRWQDILDLVEKSADQKFADNYRGALDNVGGQAATEAKK